jgi:hypothetical protein
MGLTPLQHGHVHVGGGRYAAAQPRQNRTVPALRSRPQLPHVHVSSAGLGALHPVHAAFGTVFTARHAALAHIQRADGGSAHHAWLRRCAATVRCSPSSDGSANRESFRCIQRLNGGSRSATRNTAITQCARTMPVETFPGLSSEKSLKAVWVCATAAHLCGRR